MIFHAWYKYIKDRKNILKKYLWLITQTFVWKHNPRPAKSDGLALRLTVLTRISRSHGEVQNLMVGRAYYAPKRGIYINNFTVQSRKLIKESFICSKHKGFYFFVVSLVSVISFFLKIDDFIRNGITLNSSPKTKAKEFFAKEFLFFYYSQIRSHLFVLRVKKTYLKCSLNLSRRRKWSAKISFFNWIFRFFEIFC